MDDKLDLLLDEVIERHSPSPQMMALVHREILENDLFMDTKSCESSVASIFEKAFWGLNHLNEFFPSTR